MNKNYLLIIAFLFFTNCSAPGSALLGPVFTGATTKSVTQASLSIGTNQILRKVNEAHQKSKKEMKKIAKKIEDFEFKSQYEKFIHFHK